MSETQRVDMTPPENSSLKLDESVLKGLQDSRDDIARDVYNGHENLRPKPPYTVKSGDTLSAIFKGEYGITLTDKTGQLAAEMFGLESPKDLQVGQVLKLPIPAVVIEALYGPPGP